MSEKLLSYAEEKSSHLNRITELIEAIKKDMYKFYDRGEKGLPGTRIRKALKEMQIEAKMMAKEIQESRKNSK